MRSELPAFGKFPDDLESFEVRAIEATSGLDELDISARAILSYVGEAEAEQRTLNVSDVVKEGQAVKVKLLGFDDRGKVRLSMKQVDQATGEDLAKKPAEAKAEAPQA